MTTGSVECGQVFDGRGVCSGPVLKRMVLNVDQVLPQCTFEMVQSCGVYHSFGGVLSVFV